MKSIALDQGRLLSGSMAVAALASFIVAGHDAAAQSTDRDDPDIKTSEIQIIINDGPDEGLNDPTPARPVGGNRERTLGKQRQAVFEAAAEVWERILVSDVPIKLEAQFDPLFCEPDSAVLGSAGPLNGFIDFPGAQLADVVYVSAQADQQAGVDLDPENGDLIATFNSLLGTGPECLRGIPFYLGINGQPAPEGTISLFDTVLHEIAHGLGFLSLVDEETGEKIAGFDDIFSNQLEDDTLGLPWPLLTDEERVASAINTGNLQWTGETVEFCADRVLEEGVASDGDVLMFAPDPVQPGSSVSHFDRSLAPDELMEPVATETSILDLTVAAFADMGWPVSAQAVSQFCLRPPVRVADERG